jgi:hypothetical protein
MKKALTVFIVLACAGLVQAQNIDVSANFGILTRGDFGFKPLVLSGNVTFDVALGGLFMISPECTLYSSSKFETDSLLLAPGGTFNLTYGQLFVGAGLVKEIWLKSTDVSFPLELKLQAGVRASKFRLGAYLLTFWKEMFSDLSFGFTLGFAL